MNTHVTFTTAKLLKDKGFNMPCQFLRVAGKYRIHYENEGDLFDNGCPSIQKPNDWYLCPTIAQVVMWLYEKHGIWISVDKAINVKWANNYFDYKIIDTDENKFIIQSDIGGTQPNTPTEAYSEAIEYCLTKLI
jgi:hypothetical protein